MASHSPGLAAVVLHAAEVLKRRIAGLHQITELSTVDLKETYEPKHEGLDTKEVRSLLDAAPAQ